MHAAGGPRGVFKSLKQRSDAVEISFTEDFSLILETCPSSQSNFHMRLNTGGTEEPLTRVHRHVLILDSPNICYNICYKVFSMSRAIWFHLQNKRHQRVCRIYIVSPQSQCLRVNNKRMGHNFAVVGVRFASWGCCVYFCNCFFSLCNSFSLPSICVFQPTGKP